MTLDERHTPTFAPKAEIHPKLPMVYGVFCHECSEREQDYTRCPAMDAYPEEVYGALR